VTLNQEQMHIRCLKIGSLSRAEEIDEEYMGADCMTFSSVSVALSSVLPGPVVPGFQNLRPDIDNSARFMAPSARVLGQLSK
jgi:hypothetical protein